MLLEPLALTSRSESDEELPALAACRRVRGLMMFEAEDCAEMVWRSRDNGCGLSSADDHLCRDTDSGETGCERGRGSLALLKLSSGPSRYRKQRAVKNRTR